MLVRGKGGRAGHALFQPSFTHPAVSAQTQSQVPLCHHIVLAWRVPLKICHWVRALRVNHHLVWIVSYLVENQRMVSYQVMVIGILNRSQSPIFSIDCQDRGGPVTAVGKRSHQWCVSPTPSGGWLDARNASSQTDPPPLLLVGSTLFATKMAVRNAKRSMLKVLRKNRGPVNSLLP